MKKIITLLAIWIVCGWSVASAQLCLSCEGRMDCDLDDEGNMTNCEESEFNCLFEFNKDITMFTHTTPTMKSTYYIKDQDSQETDDGDTIYIFDVVSDAGNKYKYLLNLDDLWISAIGNGYIITFKIKNAWKADDDD